MRYNVSGICDISKIIIFNFDKLGDFLFKNKRWIDIKKYTKIENTLLVVDVHSICKFNLTYWLVKYTHKVKKQSCFIIIIKKLK